MIGYIITAILLVVVDQITKFIALTKLKPIGNTTIIEGFMDFTFVENRGAAFGMLEGQIWLFVIITIIVTIGILFAFKNMPLTKEHNMLRLAGTLILAGAIGNVIDRIFRGYVVDFFEFTFISYPVFNVADIYVVVGSIAFALVMVFVIKEDEIFIKKSATEEVIKEVAEEDIEEVSDVVEEEVIAEGIEEEVVDIKE